MLLRIENEKTHRLSSADLSRILNEQLFEKGPLGCEPWKVEGPVRVGRNANIYRAVRGDQEKCLAVKVLLSEKDGIDVTSTVQEEFEALTRVSELMGDATHYRVVRPIVAIAEEGVLVTEWIDGRTLTSIMFNWKESLPKLKRAFESAGEWIHRFHAAGQSGYCSPDVDDKLRVLNSLAKDSITGNRSFLRARRVLATVSENVAQIVSARSWVHGDFKTDNLILGDAGVIGYDISIRYKNVCLYDIANFMNHVDLSCWHPKGWRIYPYRRELNDAFLSRCRLINTDVEQAALLWIRLYLALMVWRLMVRNASNGIARRYLSLAGRRVVVELTNRLEASRG